MTMSAVRKAAMSQAQRVVDRPDPYLELELYLEKVNEEIGKVFDQCFSEENAFSAVGPNDDAYDECERLSHGEDRSSDSLSFDAALQDPIEITVNDYCGGIHIATQTSPTMSQSSSPVWISDCSSSFALHSSSSSSEHGDDTSSLDNVGQQDVNIDIIISDSELLPRLRQSQLRSHKKRSGEHFPAKENLEFMQCYGSSGNCMDSEDPVWILRQDIKYQRRQRSSEDRRGVVFDEPSEWIANVNDGLDEPLNNLSAHSLPIAQNHYTSTSPSYDRVSYLMMADLGNKSSSAPVLKKSNKSSEQLSSHISKITKQPRSQSDRHLAEIQAAEACKWLRAAGFPQYAQMYEDHQFPIDLTSVQKDHPFLDFDSWQSLFRRLDTLNRCANVKVDSWRSSQMDDSDADENQCALSENWTFQHDQRRWSRCRVNEPLQPLQNITPALENSENSKNTQKDGSSAPVNAVYTNISLDPAGALEDSNFSRSGSERIRDGAKAFLRRVESLKSRRRKRQNREGIVISGPQVADVLSMQQRIKDLNCLEISSPALSVENAFEFNSPQSSPLPCSPMPSPRRPLISVPLFSTPLELTVRKSLVNRRGSVSFDRAREVAEAMSDSECQRFHRKLKHPNSTRVTKPNPNQELVHRSIDKSDTSVAHSSDYDSDVDEIEMCNQSRASWHSLQRGTLAFSWPEGSPLACLTCGQLQVLRKFALLKLTALIEKHCPTHKTGWNWELPKFIRKIKTPDYKDKLVFGVPLCVTLQRTGQPLPTRIVDALRWLRLHAVDQVGIFRKSGVRSRIQLLKTMLESKTPCSFDEQQAYDVADMVKQYFRELPEALLTTKLSETLILIFQYVPAVLRGEAVSYVLLLMPNEHCEVLQTLLEFLQYISEHSSLNQMTASNLALCFAPSLFYFNQNLSVCNGTRQNSVSPRRRKPTGVPDPKDLSENKAAHDCLLYLIRNYCTLFTVSKDMLMQCKFTDMDESKPLTLLELGSDQSIDWRGYLNQCQSALIKESKEKSRGWISLPNVHGGDVEVAYKKVGDGHPLRLWRVATEVEAPPQEVLRRVLRERHIWDHTVTKMRVVETLDDQSEVFQYVCESMHPMMCRDYCVLRTWRKDLPRGACVIVETSVEHEGAEVVLASSVRAIVLASRYLIEPCGSGKSRLMHLSRVDTMGRTPEWYNKNYGYICRLYLANIRSSFQHSATGPESKV